MFLNLIFVVVCLETQCLNEVWKWQKFYCRGNNVRFIPIQYEFILLESRVFVDQLKARKGK